VGTGSREENAVKERKKHFQAKHAPREGGGWIPIIRKKMR
jgi:hypothetical protein